MDEKKTRQAWAAAQRMLAAERKAASTPLERALSELAAYYCACYEEDGMLDELLDALPGERKRELTAAGEDALARTLADVASAHARADLDDIFERGDWAERALACAEEPPAARDSPDVRPVAVTTLADVGFFEDFAGTSITMTVLAEARLGTPREVLGALRGAVSDVLCARAREGWEMPYPYNWGDVAETLSEERFDEGLARRHGVRVVSLGPAGDVAVRHDEVVAFDCPLDA